MSQQAIDSLILKGYWPRRIPLSTCHSQIEKWCGVKPRVLVLNRVDMVSERDRASWTRYFSAAGTHVSWTDGVSGQGTGQVGKHLFFVGYSLWLLSPQLGLQRLS
jgi:ribosome biogenesis GTPase A